MNDDVSYIVNRLLSINTTAIAVVGGGTVATVDYKNPPSHHF